MSSSGVAVVITCYELGRTLPEAIESVLVQTEAAQEIVIVDDGSRDSFTAHVLARIEDESPTVHVIRSEHGGPARARNTGIAATGAPLVVLLDGDDLFEPTYLERATRLLEEREDLSFVCCALQAFGRASYRWKPPPYTVAEAVGRGACGHISTVFKRDLWERVGEFDEALPAYEDVDFWLRALELGFRGAILDEALLRYRVRPGSRYHSAVVQGEYLPAKQLLLDKHLEPVVTHGEDVLVSLLDFGRELRGHALSLRDEREQAEAALAEVERDLADARDLLEALDIPALNWGSLGRVEPDIASERSPVEEHYLRRALNDLGVEASGKRALSIRPGDGWPQTTSRFDLVLVDRALESADEPAAALEACRNALRPGGRLVVAAAPIALGEGRLRGFTEASLRAALSDLFPPGAVSVASYGNLLACLAVAAGAPAAGLRPEELEAHDPWHPALVVGVVELPRRSRGRTKRRRSEPVRTIGGTGGIATAGAILAYHRIAAHRPDTHRLCTPPEMFAEHMGLIAERYDAVSLQELVEQATVGELRQGAVAVTFDDGYLDNLVVASPILGEHGIPATFFVNGPLDDERRETWTDTVERILLGAEPVPEHLDLEAGERPLELPTRTPGERGLAARVLHGRLLDAGAAEIEAMVGELVAWSGLELPVRESHRLMTAEELVTLNDRSGHEVGAHGWSHLLLTAQPPEERSRELEWIGEGLERLLGEPVSALAYPYGGCDFDTTAIAEAAGFAIGCSVEPEAVTADCDPLRLPRLEVGTGDLDNLRFRLERAMAGFA